MAETKIGGRKNNGYLKYIPLDKSWVIRVGVLDLIHDRNTTLNFLKKQKVLSDDLVALRTVLEKWKKAKEIDVGESGTLYRFLQFISWKYNVDKKFIRKGTLKRRKITSTKEIIKFSQKKLLKLDNGTSQWASARVLCDDTERIKNPPHKLALTYLVISKYRNKNRFFLKDKTIERQMLTFIKILKGNKVAFKPLHSEDYCFARAFMFINPKVGLKRWPSLVGHESNRIKEMEKSLDQYKKKKLITSKDHRVIQAIAMLGKKEYKKATFQYPDMVSKSWPEFWGFMRSLD